MTTFGPTPGSKAYGAQTDPAGERRGSQNVGMYGAYDAVASGLRFGLTLWFHRSEGGSLMQGFSRPHRGAESPPHLDSLRAWHAPLE